MTRYLALAVLLCGVGMPALADSIARDIVTDLYGPARQLVAACCYLVGLAMIVAAGFRLLRRAHDRLGPSHAGSALMLMAGTVLIFLPAWLEALGATLFGPDRNGRLALGPDMPATTGSAVLVDALMVLLFLIGLIAAARGIALLPAAADGRASVAQALCHIVGGVALCNFPALAEAVDSALRLGLFRS